MRDLITTLFEVLGLALIAVAVGLALATLHPAAGVAGVGLTLIAESFLIDVLGGSGKPRPDGETV